jgi:hypothetical protein
LPAAPKALSSILTDLSFSFTGIQSPAMDGTSAAGDTVTKRVMQ